MRIAIVNLTGGGLSMGYRKYLLKLIPLLQCDLRVKSLDVFLPRSAAGEMSSQLPNASPISAWDQLTGYRHLKSELVRAACDVVFTPVARWLDAGRPTVVMVQNVEPLECPNGPGGANPLGDKLRNFVRARQTRHACVSATRIIAVSNHVKDILTTRWSLPPDRIGVVYNGADSPAQAQAAPAALRGLDGRGFIFTAGSIRPARGLEDIIVALAAGGSAGRVTLVIAGDVDPRMGFWKHRLIARADGLGVGSRIVWAGRLSPQEMAWCYDNCELFVMTSRAEACPNIVLEALACGCLCVSTDRPPMPEFFADAAMYYRAGESASLSAAIARALELSQDQQLAFRDAARRRAANFTWSATVERTIGELERAIAAY